MANVPALRTDDKVNDRAKVNHTDCSRLPEAGKTPEQIALDPCNCLIDQYLRFKRQNRWWSNLAQGIALIFTAAIPVVLLLPRADVNIIGAAFSAFAAIATGLMAINGWRENYVRYGYIYHMLQIEKYLYLAQATKEYPDSDPRKAAKNFARRIEELVTLDVTEWRTEMQRVEERSQ